MMTISSSPRRSLAHDPRRFPLRRRALLTSTALGAALLLWHVPAHAGPEGERIVAGQAPTRLSLLLRRESANNPYTIGHVEL